MPTACNSTGVIHSGDTLPAAAIGRAMRLAASVHDEGPPEVAALLRPLDRAALLELAVTLAAMVPVDYSPAELLAWNDHRYANPRPAASAGEQAPLFPVVDVTGGLKPHGTHAAFNRHKKRGENPCDECTFGESQYQAEQFQRRQRRAVESRSA